MESVKRDSSRNTFLGMHFLRTDRQGNNDKSKGANAQKYTYDPLILFTEPMLSFICAHDFILPDCGFIMGVHLCLSQKGMIAPTVIELRLITYFHLITIQYRMQYFPINFPSRFGSVLPYLSDKSTCSNHEYIHPFPNPLRRAGNQTALDKSLFP